jgi:hypothetical protein
MSDSLISFKELREAGSVALATIQSLTASDGVWLDVHRLAKHATPGLMDEDTRGGQAILLPLAPQASSRAVE